MNLEQFSKADLIAIVRKLGMSAGDTGRNGKGYYMDLLSTTPEGEVAAAASKCGLIEVPGVAAAADEVLGFEPERPAPQPTAVDHVQQLQSALQALLKAPKPEIDEERVGEIAREAAHKAETYAVSMAKALHEEAMQAVSGLEEKVEKLQQPRVETIVVSGGVERKVTGHVRKEFKRILRLATQGVNVFLAGPAGCGKTHLGGQLAEALGRRFGHLSVSGGISESQLLGWLLPIEANGRFVYVPAPFVDFYENGGVFLLDEIDGADANVLMVLNSALANGYLSIPQRHENPVAKRHPDFVCVAAGNTLGHGGDLVYAARERLDGATLDRFRAGFMVLDYDTDFERANVDPALLVWGLKLRSKIGQLRLRRILSTRFLLDATKLLAAGDSYEDVLDSYFADWSLDERNKVSADLTVEQIRQAA